MKVVGSVIARIGSKRLPYKNILPFCGDPMVVYGIKKLLRSPSVELIVVSTESDLIEQVVQSSGLDLNSVVVHRRSEELARDDTPSIPVFQDIMKHFPAEVHVNYNCNVPFCSEDVFERAIDLARLHGEALSVPYAAWAQTQTCLEGYGDPWTITAHQFEDSGAIDLDIHTEADLRKAHEIALKQMLVQEERYVSSEKHVLNH